MSAHVYLPRQDAYGMPWYSAADWAPVRPQPQAHLQGEVSVTLGTLSNQSDKLSQFYHWDEQGPVTSPALHAS